MKRSRTALISLLVCFCLLPSTAQAADADMAAYFTHNPVDPEGPTSPTPIEAALLAHLNGATRSIDASLYALSRVSVQEALIAAHHRGVTVRVTCDDDAYDTASYHDHFRALEAAGIPLVQDNRSSLMHNKSFVIDGAVVWTGSTNITDRGFTQNHNNGIVITSTQLAEAYTVEFEEMFIDRKFGTAKADNTRHDLGDLACYFSPTDGTERELIQAIRDADDHIYFAIFYFTSNAVRDALIARAQAGVEVRGIFDQLGASNYYAEDEALCAAGIPAKIEDFSGKLHHKFMVIDPDGPEPLVVTGSYNWTASGAERNDENTLFIHDPALARQYHARWTTLWQAIDAKRGCNLTPVMEYLSHLPLLLSRP